eukprot:3169628-Pleurochrysis_carterae.AAC.1
MFTCTRGRSRVVVAARMRGKRKGTKMMARRHNHRRETGRRWRVCVCARVAGGAAAAAARAA